MKKFRRILLAVDESPCTDKIVNYTKDLIANEEVSIALLTVIPPTSPSTYGADPLLGQQPILVPEITEIQQNTAEQYVAKVANEFQSIAEVFKTVKIKDQYGVEMANDGNLFSFVINSLDGDGVAAVATTGKVSAAAAISVTGISEGKGYTITFTANDTLKSIKVKVVANS